MARKRKFNPNLPLKPLHSVLFVSEKGSTSLPVQSIKSELVGKKAFGLCCLPKAWTPSFIVVSNELLSSYRSSSLKKRTILIKNWANKIIHALRLFGLEQDDHVLVRSSGHMEGLYERGRFYSVQGTVKTVAQTVVDCLNKIVTDKELKTQEIALVIQKGIVPFSAKGHLSNERRCYEENRDWLGEFEGMDSRHANNQFTINLRNWRRKVTTTPKDSLKCNLLSDVQKVLEIPAAWGYEKHLRLHFEWVWDGEVVYIVQVDQEATLEGIDPAKIYSQKYTSPSSFIPKCLKEIDQTLIFPRKSGHNEEMVLV